MKALILNSGTGSRMGDLTRSQPKCMTTLGTGQTILSRQISQLEAVGVAEVIITTGPFKKVLERHAQESAKTVKLRFVNNPKYTQTNYIYSIYLARELLDHDILMLHGDLVFSDGILRDLFALGGSAMTVSSTLPLPQKDFKAVLSENRIMAVGVEFFNEALTAQPLYKLDRGDWNIWLGEITRFVTVGDVGCYAENAFNRISRNCKLLPFDVKDRLCAEIDMPEDLEQINRMLHEEQAGGTTT